MEVRQRRHRFGWWEVLSMAAAIAVLLLGAFSARWLLLQKGAQTAANDTSPVKNSATEAAGTANPAEDAGQTAPTDQPQLPEQVQTPEPSEPTTWDGEKVYFEAEELTIFNPLLSYFAEQDMEEYPQELCDQFAELRFAHTWYRIHDPEAIVPKLGADGVVYDTLTEARMNDLFLPLMGFTVSGGADEDGDVLYGEDAAGRVFWQEDCFWFSAGEIQNWFGFAICTEGWRPSIDDKVFYLRFTVYRASETCFDRLGREGLTGLTAAEAQALEQAGDVEKLAEGRASFQDSEEDLRITLYTIKDEEGQTPIEPEPTGWPTIRWEDWVEINRLLTDRAQEEASGRFGGSPQRFFAAGLYSTGTLETSLEVGFELCRANVALWPEYYDLDPATLTTEQIAELARQGLVDYVGDGTALLERPYGQLLLTAWDCFCYGEEDPVGSVDREALKASLEEAFSDERSWNVRALTGAYPDPLFMDLGQLFYDGIPGVDNTLTEDERAALEALGAELELDCDRLPRAEINRVLEETFGKGLNWFARRGLDRFYYLQETDCWYHVHSDTNLRVGGVEILDAYMEDDGSVSFTYRARNPRHPSAEAAPIWTAKVTPLETGGYRLISNLPGQWMTPETLGLAGAFYLSEIHWQCETEDADGARTVRRLDFAVDGSLRYREGDPNSEFSTWYAGSWWFQDQTLHCELAPADETGVPMGSAVVSFDCTFSENAMTLRQLTNQGLRSGDSFGTELRFTLIDN